MLYLTALQEGLLYGLLALGVYISLRVLDIPDLTTEGSFGFGSALAAVLAAGGHTYLSLPIAFLGGMAAGLITGLLQTKLQVHPVLAGIITMSGLYSVNLIVRGGPNLSIGAANLFKQFYKALHLTGDQRKVAGALLALVICFGITPLFNQSISQKAEIVRVTKDIHAGELITKDMVTTAEVGSYNLPSGLMTAKDNVVGKYAKADLAVGDYILAAKLSDAPAAENAYLYNLDGTKQAISVTIKSFATGLSGKLQSGDIVSVIVADYPEDGETTIPAELQYVEIISVTASTGYDANTGEAKGDEKELPSTVTFLVLPEQAKVLAELEQVAKLHLALVYRGTTDGARQFIEAQDALIEELYAEPEEDPIEEGEAADPTAEMPESEVTG